MEQNIDFIISEDLKRILVEIELYSPIAKRILELNTYTSTINCNYMGLASDIIGNLSFLTNDKMLKLQPENYWQPNLRLGAKPSKIIQKLFKDEYTDLEKQNFSIALKTEIIIYNTNQNDVDKIVIVEGEDIKKYYNENSYVEHNNREYEDSSLLNSCMRYNRCSAYFDIYVKNPNQIKMAVIFDEYKNYEEPWLVKISNKLKNLFSKN